MNEARPYGGCQRVPALSAFVLVLVFTFAIGSHAWGQSTDPVPVALRAATLARDSAFFKADVAAWERYTSAGFWTVQQDGTKMTRAERVANLRMQTPKPVAPISAEYFLHAGDAYMRRFRSGDLWVMEIWIQQSGAWKSVASQVTTAKKD